MRVTLHESTRLGYAADSLADADRLAAALADRCEPNRGYGVGAFTILRRAPSGC